MTTSTQDGGASAVDGGQVLPGATISAAGLRRTSPGSIRARRLADSYREPGAARPPRAACLKVLKRAAPALGLTPMMLALLDQLFAASKPIDWSGDGGLGPYVWTSNNHLARRTNASSDTVRRKLRAFAGSGLIAYRDDPTCRRHGRRDEDGRIVEAFGIDLSPIAMRYEELSRIADAVESEARAVNALRCRRTVLQKDIRSLISSALQHEGQREGQREEQRDGCQNADTDADVNVCGQVHTADWTHGLARLDVIRERRPRDLEGLEQQVLDLEVLYERLEALYDGVFEASDAVPDLCKSAHPGGHDCTPHTTTAPTDNSGICNQSGIVLTDDTQSVRAAYGSRAFERKPVADFINNKQSPVETESQKEIILPDAPAVAMQLRDETAHLSIGLLRAACPNIAAVMEGALDDWNALRNSGRSLCIQTGVNPQVWQEACDTIGPDLAVAATAVTLQKAAMGLVASPGAYLRTLTKRGKAGNLNIMRSLHGLASHNDPANWGREIQSQDDADNTQQEGAVFEDGDEAAVGAAVQAAGPDKPVAAEGPERRLRPERGQRPDQPDSKATRSNGTEGLQGIEGPADLAGLEGLAGPENPVVAQAIPFPQSASILYSPWADIVRQNIPKPVPDVDIVAHEFRRFCKKNAIDTTSPNIKTVFTTFCLKWKKRTWNTH